MSKWLVRHRLEKSLLARGVPLVPGLENIKNNDEITELGKTAGYPLLIKAALGGGGKGMRVVEKEEEILDAIERAKSEALNSFGDDKIIVEKYIQNPRHVEVQVLADKHGQVAILGDRDCSVQRRHQKIVEEAPATNIHPSTREKCIKRQRCWLRKLTTCQQAL